jgi:hypothetical protein
MVVCFSPHFSSSDEDLSIINLDRDENSKLVYYQHVEDDLISKKTSILETISRLRRDVDNLDSEIHEVQKIIHDLMTDLGYH